MKSQDFSDFRQGLLFILIKDKSSEKISGLIFFLIKRSLDPSLEGHTSFWQTMDQNPTMNFYCLNRVNYTFFRGRQMICTSYPSFSKWKGFTSNFIWPNMLFVSYSSDLVRKISWLSGKLKLRKEGATGRVHWVYVAL